MDNEAMEDTVVLEVDEKRYDVYVFQGDVLESVTSAIVGFFSTQQLMLCVSGRRVGVGDISDRWLLQHSATHARQRSAAGSRAQNLPLNVCQERCHSKECYTDHASTCQQLG